MNQPKKSPVEIFAEQKRRLGELTERRTRAQVTLEAEQRALAEAQAEAVRLFGTSDLDALRTMYRERTEENDRKVVEFVMALDEVERLLADIERQIAV